MQPCASRAGLSRRRNTRRDVNDEGRQPKVVPSHEMRADTGDFQCSMPSAADTLPAVRSISTLPLGTSRMTRTATSMHDAR